MSDAISEVIVKGTLVLLLAFSIVTWAFVLLKGIQAGRAGAGDKRSQRVLGSLRTLPPPTELKDQDGPAVRVALAGIEAWNDVSDLGAGGGHELKQELLERSLSRQIHRERRRAESGLAVLASIGTTSPFVGLFGTVWGIMHALKAISGAGSASLDVVAGPIGEALVATGIGIAVAVPAVLAYNYFVRRLKVQSGQLEELASSLVTAALRDALGESRDTPSSERVLPKVVEARKSSPLREARV
jgi:biopolymer transport protein ExbB